MRLQTESQGAAAIAPLALPPEGEVLELRIQHLSIYRLHIIIILVPPGKPTTTSSALLHPTAVDPRGTARPALRLCQQREYYHFRNSHCQLMEKLCENADQTGSHGKATASTPPAGGQCRRCQR